MLILENYSDQELLQQTVEGCDKSFETLFKRYHGFLYHYCFRVFRDDIIADEVTQKTFVKIWEIKESLVNIKSFKNYIYTINRRLVVDELRTISRNKELAGLLAQRIVHSHSSVEEEVIYNDLQYIAEQAIEQLPPKRKEIFKLSRESGFSHREIAEKLNISENTVKVSVSKSLKQIKNYLLLNADITYFLLAIYLLM